MTAITADQLRAVCVTQEGKNRVGNFILDLNTGMTRFNISTPERIAAFIAQVFHESGECRYVKELASGAAYDTGRLAERLGNTPEDDDDGERYKGRGLIQITGIDNYRAVSTALGFDFIAKPDQLAESPYAATSACWFWYKRGLNELADIDSFDEITKRINGGQNGAANRHMYWGRAKKAFGVA